MPIYGFSVPDMMGIDEKPGIKGKEVIPVERHKAMNGLFCGRKCASYMEKANVR